MGGNSFAMSSSGNKIYLLYDGECPVCHNYAIRVRVQEAAGELLLISAREESDMLKQVTVNGWDIDKGMVLKLGNTLYYGKDAIRTLSLLSTRSSLFNRLNFWLFRYPVIAGVLYPLCKIGRDMLLWVLRIPKIRNRGK